MSYKIIHPHLTSEYIETIHTFLTESGIKPQLPQSLLGRFLQNLISSSQNVIEVWDGENKIACAVLVDKIMNPHKSASVEFLGFKNVKNPQELLTLMLEHFELITLKRDVHLANTVSFHPSLPFESHILNSLGYDFFYETYDLSSPQRFNFQKNLDPLFSISTLKEKDFDEYYKVLCESFANNPDTSIGSLEYMKNNFKKQIIPTFIAKKENTIVGFITLLMDNNIGEINTLGVLPEFRKSGIGKNLLAMGVDYLWNMKVNSIKLTVAVQNKKALDLYLNSGFEIQESYLTLRKKL